MVAPAEMVEEAVLGGVMVWDRPWPSEVLELEPEYFTDAKRAQIWEAAQALIRAHSKVDEITLTAQLALWDVSGVAGYIHDLAMGTPCESALVDWARLLVEDGLRRKARSAVADALGRCDDNAHPDDIAAAVTDAVRHVRVRSDLGPQHTSAVVGATVKELEREHNEPGVSRVAVTGLADLDRDTELRAGDLTIIAGRPSMGKSALAGNIAQRCGRGEDRGAVVVFSLEMSITSLIRRMLASASGFAMQTLPEQAAKGLLTDAAQQVHSLNCYIDDRPNVTVAAMQAALGRINEPIRLVVFDYLQLAKMDDKEKNHALRVGQVTKGLKGIAKEFGCHVIGLSQLNRSVESRHPPRPRLSDLRDSGNIEEDADNAWLLYRPSYYGKSDAPVGETEIIIAKQRNGRTGFVKVWWDGATQTFKNYARGA